VEQVAYRFLPCDDGGRPLENSEYTTLSDDQLGVGSRIEVDLFGYACWEVVEMREESGPLVAVCDRFGRDIPVAGTLICRGVASRLTRDCC
jgi:hypothetical protein